MVGTAADAGVADVKAAVTAARRAADEGQLANGAHVVIGDIDELAMEQARARLSESGATVDYRSPNPSG